MVGQARDRGDFLRSEDDRQLWAISQQLRRRYYDSSSLARLLSNSRFCDFTALVDRGRSDGESKRLPDFRPDVHEYPV
jgi:hypothetical protein